VDIKTNSLVLYKKGAARVKRVDEKLHLELAGAKERWVRPKDVTLLHPGPIGHLSDLQDLTGEAETAWDLLNGSSTTLAELAELIFGAFSPDTAWATWNLVIDGLLFVGSPEELRPVSAAEVGEERNRRETVASEQASWDEFVSRLKDARFIEEDTKRLVELERLATGHSDRSRALRALNRGETAENAHRLLLEIGRWPATTNPHPRRFGVLLTAPQVEIEDFADGKRVDLTHLDSFAIDDEGNRDPDDALSIEGDRLWIHVADAAGLAPADSVCDLAARSRSATLYLPESTVPMLPEAVIDRLGLGLQERNNALSFGLDFDSLGAVKRVEVVLSKVRVQRTTYTAAEELLDREPFRTLSRWCHISRERRREGGAVFIELPEVKILYRNGDVSIDLLPETTSRQLVSEAMLLAGEAIGRFGLDNGIPLPFATQRPAAEIWHEADGLAGMCQRRKSLKRSLVRSVQGPHAGLGLESYVQATSPMRRYLDLVVHQQLRAFLSGRPGLNDQQLLERVGATTELSDLVRKAERTSNLHWKLVYLSQNPSWKGAGTVVEQRDGRCTVLIPQLGQETGMFLSGNVELNEVIDLRVDSVDIPGLEARFQQT
jgi:exoribonuclease-2